ncbi:hypothetical protein PENTCL1PPCAC_19700, partial [Pristionchus entomophagus]
DDSTRHNRSFYTAPLGNNVNSTRQCLRFSQHKPAQQQKFLLDLQSSKRKWRRWKMDGSRMNYFLSQQHLLR